MADDSDHLTYLYSAPGATAGNTAPGASGLSLGRYAAYSRVPSAVIDDLFPDITGVENLAANVDYQCLFVLNAHPRNALQSSVLWIEADIAGGSNWDLAVDNIPASDIGSQMQQADVIANKNTAPVAVGAFSTPLNKASALALGTIGPGQVKAFWVRRSAVNSPQLSVDGGRIRVEGNTYF